MNKRGRNPLSDLHKRIALHLSFHNENTFPFVMEGLMASIVLYLTNPFYQLFATAMGASDFGVGMINALPALFALFILIPAAARVDGMSEKKPFVLKMIVWCGVLLPACALAPFLGKAGPWVFIVGIAIWNIPYICYTASWQSYFSDLFAPRERNMPYAWRMAATNGAAMVVVLIGGVILTYACKTGQQKIVAYQAFFLLAGIMSIFQWQLMKKTRQLTPSQGDKAGIKYIQAFIKAIKSLRNNKAYASFSLTLFIFYFSWQMGWPLFFIYLIRYSGHTELTKLMLDALSFVVLAFSSAMWGRMMAKKDVRKLIVIGIFGCAIGPFWTASSAGLLSLAASYAFGGLMQPAFQMGLFHRMLDLVPEDNRTLNIGIYNSVIQVSGFIAPLCGVAISNALGVVKAMYLVSLARFSAGVLFLIIYLYTRKREKGRVGHETCNGSNEGD